MLSIPTYCGPLTYSIVEAYSFSSLITTGDPGQISIYTILISDVQVYTATFSAKLANYAAVAAATTSFTITIVNPCLGTVLSLPTTLNAVTITSRSGLGDTQTFLPASDTAGVAST